MLTIALPKGKSLEERTVALFEEARIPVIRTSPSSHKVEFADCPFLSEGVLLKPQRVPILVAEGDIDIGITGSDIVLESGADVGVQARFTYSRKSDTCTQGVIFAHKDDCAKSKEDIPDGAVILSEYPRLTRDAFLHWRSIQVVESPGSAEAEVPLKYRFGVALTETGRSLRENGLKIVDTLFFSDTVLIVGRKVWGDDNKRGEILMLRSLLLGALEARGRVFLSMNVSREVMEGVLKILPALDKPTVATLAGGEHFSISTVVLKNKVNILIHEVLKLGAKGIITTPITSVIEKW